MKQPENSVPWKETLWLILMIYFLLSKSKSPLLAAMMKGLVVSFLGKTRSVRSQC